MLEFLERKGKQDSRGSLGLFLRICLHGMTPDDEVLATWPSTVQEVRAVVTFTPSWLSCCL